MDIDNQLLSLIEEKTSVLFEIEKVLFTKRYKLSKKHLEIFSVQSIAMVYAIWEGFIQQSFRLYIDEINSLDIDFDNLCEQIRINHIENHLRQLKFYPSKDKKTKKVTFHKKLKDFFSKTPKIDYSIINTQSNVNFKELNNILTSFCLIPFKEHWNEKGYTHPKPNLEEMMKRFLNYRNVVSHGGDISSEEKVTQEVYQKYRALVENLMYKVRDKMLEGLESQSYLDKT
jgi:hypothetical protein